MEKLEKVIAKYWIIILLLLSIPAGGALFVQGYYGASDDMHPAWLFELDKTIKLGQIPPRYVPDLSFGFGYPLFDFVFPLPFYAAESFHLLGLSLVDSIKAVFFLSIVLSGYFMFLLLREFSTKALSLIGAILYIYTPYRSVDIYIRGAVGEIVSFIFFPMIVLSVFKLSSSFDKKWIAIGGVFLAFLIMSHNIAAYMFFPLLLLLSITVFIFSPKKILFFVNLSFMFTLGLLISCYFWLPALVESSLMKYDAVFNFVDHFPTLRQLFTPYWGYGASVPGPGDGMSFFLGIGNILILVTALVISIWKWKKLNLKVKILIGWSFACLALVIFLMNHRSTIIWTYFPLLPLFQFPWRFLIITTFTIPLLVVVLDQIKFKALGLFAILALILVTSISIFRPQDFLGRQDDYYLNRYIPYPNASQEYLTLQEEYLRLPKSNEKRPDKNYPLVFPEDNIKNINRINDLSLTFNTEAQEYSEVSINKYYFPGWIGKIDGNTAQLYAGKPFGQISLMIPPGDHKVEVYFKETDFRKILNFASLAAFLVSLVMVLI